ncbi:ATP-binding protein [Treponema sp. R8-4-B8]
MQLQKPDGGRSHGGGGSGTTQSRGAGRAVLVVRRTAEHILICVSDDGIGIRNVPGIFTAGGGLGIRSIRQRAAIMGAKIDFISESGNGLMVRIELSPPPPPVHPAIYGGYN